MSAKVFWVSSHTNIAAAPLRQLGVLDLPAELLSLLRFGRGIDNRRLKGAGFTYRYTSAGAVENFARFCDPSIDAQIDNAEKRGQCLLSKGQLHRRKREQRWTRFYTLEPVGFIRSTVMGREDVPPEVDFTICDNPDARRA